MRGDKGGDDVVTDGAKRTPRRFGRDGTRCNVEPGAGVLYELGIGRVVAMAGDNDIDDGVGDDGAAERAGVDGMPLEEERADKEMDAEAATRSLTEGTVMY